MNQGMQNELKKEFQLERMILFSDAVFAIAITLLAIEIKVPEIAKQLATDHLLQERLLEMIPKFVGFFVSFLVIGIYWVAHHRIFGYVIDYNHRLLWLNLIFLMAVVMMPFSSGIYSEYVIRQLKLPVVIYVANIMLLGIMNLIIWSYVSNPKHKLSHNISPQVRRYIRFRSMAPPVIFFLMGILYLYVKPAYALWLPLLIIPIMRLLQHRYAKPPVPATPAS